MSFFEKQKQRMLKSAFEMIGTDTISEMITGLMEKAISYKKGIALEGTETDIIGLLYEQDQQIYFALAGFDQQADKVTRYIEHYSVSELAQKIVKQA